jgi:hypothetical protein
VFNLLGIFKRAYFITSTRKIQEMPQSLISPYVALQIACEFAHSHAIGQVLQYVNLLSQGFLSVFPFSSHYSLHTQGNFERNVKETRSMFKVWGVY